MKSIKTQEVLPGSSAAKPRKAAKPGKAAATEKKTAAAPTKSSSAKNVVAKRVAPQATPKKNAAPKKKADAKKAIKNAIKFDKKITDKLKKIVANYTEYPELLDNIERDTTKSFIDELNIDSVDFVEIIVDVEQEFNITIEDDEIYELKSFEDLYSAIETKIRKAKK